MYLGLLPQKFTIQNLLSNGHARDAEDLFVDNFDLKYVGVFLTLHLKL